jgi:non-reducing end alpha-L-arabinofuranosidase
LRAQRSRIAFFSLFAGLFVGLSACSSGSEDPAGHGGSGASGGRASGTGGALGGGPGAAGARAEGGASAVGQGGGAGRSATGGAAGSPAVGGSGVGGIVETGGSNAPGGAGGSNAPGGAGGGSATPVGPCDIFETGKTPCVAAHSTVRLLSSAYSGPLYQVRRPSDGKTQDISFLAQSGTADSAAQETFCTGTKCTISVVYDQSGKGNHLTRSLGGAEVCRHKDQEAIADALPLMLGGHKVYAIKVVPDTNGGCTPPSGGEGTGYRLDKTKGIATGDDAETEYMVTSGSSEAHGNSGCCFDYGNVETSDKDDGAATMEAIYFGGGAGWGRGGGSGPWVLADMENGVFSGATNNYTGNTSVPYAYVTAALIGRAGGTYALLAGNAQTGELKTMYDGPRPNGYTKMKKQGAIVLGTGGDNSDHGQGYFFEGVMTTGAASASVMNLVHANILTAGYGK